MVIPILTYEAEIWGHTYSSDIEKIQTEFCRYFLVVNSSVNNDVVLGESGSHLLSQIYFTKCIKYWCKLLQMSDTRYPPKDCYKMIMSHDNIGRTNWVTNIKELLYRYGYGYVWLNQDVGDMKMFIFFI